MNKLLVWDEYKLDFMLVGATQSEISNFEKWTKNNLYDSNISIDLYKVPKGVKTSNVYIISTGTKTIREEAYNYWIRANFKDYNNN